MSQDQPIQKSWPFAVLLAWLVPGLGHWYLGRRAKAAVFFVMILGLFMTGWGLGQWKVVDFRDQWLFVGQVLSGTAAVFTGLVSKKLIAATGPANPVPVAYEMGVLYTLVAGLLNLLVMFDAYLVANNIRRPTQEKESREAEAGKGGAA